MALTMSQRKAVSNETAVRYRGASKPEKGRILKEFVTTTKYVRKYAAWVADGRFWKARLVASLPSERMERVGSSGGTAHRSSRCEPEAEAEGPTSIPRGTDAPGGACAARCRETLREYKP